MTTTLCKQAKHHATCELIVCPLGEKNNEQAQMFALAIPLKSNQNAPILPSLIIYCIVLHLLLVSCRRAHRTLHTVLTDRKQVVMLSTYCNFNVYCILNRTTVTISFMSESTGHNTRGHMKQVAMLSTAFTISCMS